MDGRGGGRDKKNLRNSEYSGFRLFGRIECVPPLKTKKLPRVMRRTVKQPWIIFYRIALAKNMPLRPRHTFRPKYGIEFT